MLNSCANPQVINDVELCDVEHARIQSVEHECVVKRAFGELQQLDRVRLDQAGPLAQLSDVGGNDATSFHLHGTDRYCKYYL